MEGAHDDPLHTIVHTRVSHTSRVILPTLFPPLTLGLELRRFLYCTMGPWQAEGLRDVSSVSIEVKRERSA